MYQPERYFMTHIIILCIFIIIVWIFAPNSKIEDFNGSLPLTNEGIQNVSSVYNDKGTATFPNVKVMGTLTDNMGAILPKGTICMWNGEVAPSGWALCDGQNTTPDLRDKFVFGLAPGTSKIGNTGGASEHTLTVNEIPAHDHAYAQAGFWGNGNYPASGGSSYGAKNAYINQTNPPTGGGAPHNNMPPYIVLAFIIKL